MDAKAENENTQMRALGEANGYIVVQPTAPGNNWNSDAHGKGCSGTALPNATRVKQTCFVPPFDEEPVGDVAVNNWVREALEVNEWKIDHNRLHLMGFSEGGWMTG